MSAIQLHYIEERAYISSASIFKLQQLTLKQCGREKQLSRGEETYICIFDIGVNCNFKHSSIL